MTDAHTVPAPEPLRFSQSESSVVGLHGSFMDKMRANSVRIVGTLKLVGDCFIGFGGSPLLIAYSIFAGIGRLIMIAYGTKANQKKAAAAIEGHEPEKVGAFAKVLRPREYPMEAAAGASLIGESAAGIYGAELIHDGISKGWPIMICELFALFSYGNLLFGKEKKKEPGEQTAGAKGQSLVFASSTSKVVGWWGKLRQKMKENPVIVSSIINVGIGLTMMLASTSVPYLIGGAILLAANILQAVLVKKKEFNVEGALEDKQTEQGYVARLEQQRRQRDADSLTALPA